MVYRKKTENFGSRSKAKVLANMLNRNFDNQLGQCCQPNFLLYIQNKEHPPLDKIDPFGIAHFTWLSILSHSCCFKTDLDYFLDRSNGKLVSQFQFQHNYIRRFRVTALFKGLNWVCQINFFLYQIPVFQ